MCAACDARGGSSLALFCLHIRCETGTLSSVYLSGSVGIAPTRWVFGGRRRCCLICAQCVSRRGGGGYVGYIRKALEMGYLENRGFACCIDDMSEIFRPFRIWPVLLAASFCQQAATMSAYKFSPRAVASPDAPQKPLVRQRARSGGGGVKWVQVSRDEPSRKAKKPQQFSVSQQPACTHEDHQTLSTAEAASFASQFWVGASQGTQAAGLEKTEKNMFQFTSRGLCAPMDHPNSWGLQH